MAAEPWAGKCYLSPTQAIIFPNEVPGTVTMLFEAIEIEDEAGQTWIMRPFKLEHPDPGHDATQTVYYLDLKPVPSQETV